MKQLVRSSDSTSRLVKNLHAMKDPAAANTAEQINPKPQNNDSAIDQPTRTAAMYTRDASGKRMGSVFLPASLSPSRSGKSWAWIVVKIRAQLRTSARTATSSRLRLGAKKNFLESTVSKHVTHILEHWVFGELHLVVEVFGDSQEDGGIQDVSPEGLSVVRVLVSKACLQGLRHHYTLGWRS